MGPAISIGSLVLCVRFPFSASMDTGYGGRACVIGSYEDWEKETALHFPKTQKYREDILGSYQVPVPKMQKMKEEVLAVALLAIP